MQYSNRYILGFALLVCLVCSVFVAGSAVGLRDRQIENALLARQEKILGVAGILPADHSWPAARVKTAFEQRIEAKVVELATGAYVPSVDARTYDQRKATRDPARSHVAPANNAKVMRLPKFATVYLEKDGTKVRRIILPVEGKGLWSTMYGFVALAPDLETIAGLTFYEHGETPGLGGEIENPRWLGLWPGRKAFNPQGEPSIEVIKGAAGPASEAPYQVDGLSGATITSRGVSYLLRFWLGENGFGPYLRRLAAHGV